MRCIIPRQTRHRANNFLKIPKAEVTVPLIEQILRQIQLIYSDKDEGPANNIRRMDRVGDDNVEMIDKVVYESVYSTIFRSRSRIQSIKSGFKLIRFNDSRRG